MSVADHFREKLEEEGEQYQTAYVSKIAGSLPKDCILIANLSGRSDKDVEQASKYLL
jgi:tryptophan synthase beta subunit